MITRQKKQLSEEYRGLLNRDERHTYAQKRQAAHLARICAIENLLPLCSPKPNFSEAYREAQNIIQSERKKYGAY